MQKSILSSIMPLSSSLGHLLSGMSSHACDHAACRLKVAMSKGAELKLVAIKETGQFEEGVEYPVNSIVSVHDDSRDEVIAPEHQGFLFIAETVDRDGVRAMVKATLVDDEDAIEEAKENWPSLAGEFPDVVIFKSAVEELKAEDETDKIKKRLEVLASHYEALINPKPSFGVGDLVWLKPNCDVYRNPDPGQPVLVVRMFDTYREVDNPGSEGHDFSFAHLLGDDVIITSAASWRFEKCPDEVVEQFNALIGLARRVKALDGLTK